MLEEVDLLAEVQTLVGPFGAVATALGYNSVAVMGDARFYGPTVIVKFPPSMSIEACGLLSTRITNEIPGIARVLMEIEHQRP